MTIIIFDPIASRTFGLMFRASGVLVLCLFTAMLLAPMAVLLEFHVHRAQIEKELCVQRDVVEAMRTCHGECQLSKRFKALEQRSTAEFPMDRIQVRLEPQVPIGQAKPVLLLPCSERIFPSVNAAIRTGFFRSDDHVPRG